MSKVKEFLKDSGRRRTTLALSAVIFIMLLIISGVVFLHGTQSNDTTIASPSETATTSPYTSNEDSDDSSSGTDGLSTDQEEAISSFDWDSLKGEKLSNAYSLLSNSGIKRSELTVNTVTSDGKMVFNEGNWTITSVEFTKPNTVLFHLNHDTTGSAAVGSVLSDIRESAGL